MTTLLNSVDRDIGKVATATFFAKSMLPRLAAQRRIIDAVDLTIMEMPEEAF
jgi:Acetyl-CoA dehydrogenase C-terminal like